MVSCNICLSLFDLLHSMTISRFIHIAENDFISFSFKRNWALYYFYYFKFAFFGNNCFQTMIWLLLSKPNKWIQALIYILKNAMWGFFFFFGQKRIVAQCKITRWCVLLKPLVNCWSNIDMPLMGYSSIFVTTFELFIINSI